LLQNFPVRFVEEGKQRRFFGWRALLPDGMTRREYQQSRAWGKETRCNEQSFFETAAVFSP